MFDLATAKIRLGITGNAQDAQVQLALDTAMAVAERHCDRRFAYSSDVAKFYNFEGDTLFLPRYPLEAVFFTRGLPETIKVHHRLGTVEIGAYFRADEIEVNYSGGYQTLPPDLELALWGVFDVLYPGVAGQGAGGSIESVTIPDVGTIRYSTTAPVVPAVDANVLGAYYSLLDSYRRRTC